MAWEDASFSPTISSRYLIRKTATLKQRSSRSSITGWNDKIRRIRRVTYGGSQIQNVGAVLKASNGSVSHLQRSSTSFCKALTELRSYISRAYKKWSLSGAKAQLAI